MKIAKEQIKVVNISQATKEDDHALRALTRKTPAPLGMCQRPGHQHHKASKCYFLVGFPPDHPGQRRNDDGRNNNKTLKQNKIVTSSDEDSDYATCFSIDSPHSPTPSRDDWTADSAATAHMTSNSDSFREIRQVSSRFILVGNGDRIPVLGIGTVVVTTKRATTMTLNDTLYAPGLKCNLFSLRAMHSSGKTVIFPWNDSKHTFVKDKRGKCLATGTLQKNNLYRMNFSCKNRAGYIAYP